MRSTRQQRRARLADAREVAGAGCIGFLLIVLGAVINLAVLAASVYVVVWILQKTDVI